MKKLISLLILASVLLLTLPAFASEGGSNLAGGNITAKAGDVVEFPIMLTGCPGFSNISFEAEYDASAMELIGAVNGCSAATLTKPQTMDSNPYNMIWNSSEKVVFEGTIVTLQFKISETALGIYPIEIKFYAGREGTHTDGYHGNYDENLESLNMTYTDGSITVEEVESGVPSGAYIKVSDKKAAKGNSLDVEVELVNCTGFSNLALEFSYDSSVFTLTGVSAALAGTTLSTSETTDKNPYSILWYSESNTVYNGKIATLHFSVSENASYGEYPITVSHYKGRNNSYVDGYHVNFDVNMESLNLSYLPGVVEIKPEKHELSASLIKTEEGLSLDVSCFSPEDEISGVVFAALYENHRLVKMTLVEDNRALFTESGDIIKVMWWDSLGGCMPYTEPVELEIPEV